MKPIPVLILLLFICFLQGFPQSGVNDTAKTKPAINRAIELLHPLKLKADANTIIKVAVVDDGFRLSHKALKPYIYENLKEVPGNLIDDDNNGYTDDLNGYDVSDGDPDVSIPADKIETYYHGTYITGIITSVFKEFYGDNAEKHLRIIPVKAISDDAKRTYISDGYKGIAYAIAAGADIIVCAWSGGNITSDERAILQKAMSKGILLVASAGNFYSEKTESPSDQPGVLCVAALDSSLRKLKMSNFDMKVDLCAPGQSVFGAFPLADNSFTLSDGTSPAAALVGGCAAVLKALKPELTRQDIIDALKNTATPVDSLNLNYCGKLGAGYPDMRKAIEFVSNPSYRESAFTAKRPEGKIYFRKKSEVYNWDFKPFGAYHGINLKTNNRDISGNIKIYSAGNLVMEGTLKDLIKGNYFKGSDFRIEIDPKTLTKSLQELEYSFETIDSTTLFCRDIVEYTRESDTITDGSGPDNYAGNCACKWQIKVAPGKKIRLDFTEMDTEANVDFVWIFEGKETLQESIAAKFSGQNKPPVIISYTNEILLWFVTDGQKSGQGWKMNYTTVDQSVTSGLEKE